MEHKTQKKDQNNNRSLSVKRGDRVDVIRRKRKPLMEKRRRARINASLEQLKKLVLDATRRDSARYSKLEKADILELTVKHIKEVGRTMHPDANLFSKLHDGFGECVAEVDRCLSSFDGVNPELHARLMTHLSSCLQRRSPPMPIPGHAMPTLTPFPAGIPLSQAQQQELAAAFHAFPPGVPRATSLQSLPGAAVAFETVARNIQNGSVHPSVSPLDARAFQTALMQAHQSSTKAHERAQNMDRLLNSATGNANMSKEFAMAKSLKNEPVIKMEGGLESLYFKQRMLALQHGDKCWRPW